MRDLGWGTLGGISNEGRMGGHLVAQQLTVVAAILYICRFSAVLDFPFPCQLSLFQLKAKAIQQSAKLQNANCSRIRIRICATGYLYLHLQLHLYLYLYLGFGSVRLFMVLFVLGLSPPQIVCLLWLRMHFSNKLQIIA